LEIGNQTMKLKSPDGQRPTEGRRTVTQLTGQFVSYEIKDGYKIKRLNLLTADGIQAVKLTKAVRASIFRLAATAPISPGTLLALAVEAKLDDGVMKYKAHALQILATGTPISITPVDAQFDRAPQTTKITKIRVCDRGTCRKRGAQEVYAQLEQAIRDRGLVDRIVVETTGCLDQCKQGPNVTIGKACHSQVCPSRASQLLPLT
jgi:NADH:ubiquinone oxidoreductase subunit E